MWWVAQPAICMAQPAIWWANPLQTLSQGLVLTLRFSLALSLTISSRLRNFPYYKSQKLIMNEIETIEELV